jgi:uncharacterized membrane protein
VGAKLHSASFDIHKEKGSLMKRFQDFALNAIVSGFLIVIPVYLTILLLIRIMKSLVGFVQPVAVMLPDWFPAGNLLALLLIVLMCFLIGVLVRTPMGSTVLSGFERNVCEKIPGYVLFRSLSQQLTGSTKGDVWKPALAEIEEALVPAFIIEKLDDGRYTVFVPSVPTPLAGTTYVLTPERVHPVNVPFAYAIRAVARWGLGSKDLVAAMTTQESWKRSEP